MKHVTVQATPVTSALVKKLQNGTVQTMNSSVRNSWSRHRLSQVALTLVLLFAIGGSPAVGVERTDWTDKTANGALNENQPRIDRVSFEPQNVFSPGNEKRWWVYRFLNSMHIVTRKGVLRAETLLEPGDIFDPAKAYETERNLRALPFIYDAFVSVDTVRSAGAAGDSVVLRVRTMDKWTLNGGAEVTRRLGHNDLKVGVEEKNLLGQGHHASFDYVFSSVDPSFFIVAYRHPRLMGKALRPLVNYRSDPLDKSGLVRLSKPYVSRDDRSRIVGEWQTFDRRTQQIKDADTIATYFEEGDRWSLDGFSRSGDYNTKLEFGAGYSYVQQRVNKRTLYTSDLVEFPDDSVAQVIRLSAKLQSDKFYRTRRINYQFRTEDVTISRGVALAFSQRRGPGFRELLYNSLEASLYYDLQRGNFIAKSLLKRTGWFVGAREFRTVTSLSLRGYHNGVRWMTFAGRAFYAHDRRSIDYDPLSVDEDRGVRGYPFNYLTGSHTLVGSLEARFHSGVTVLTTRLGFATFIDFGTAWNSGERMKLSDYIWSAGIGLRLDLAQIGGGRVARLDAAYAGESSSWEFSAGMGQFFELF